MMDRMSGQRRFPFAMVLLLPAVLPAQSRAVLGTVKSSASLAIAGTSMPPSAAPSWPVVEGDEIGVSAAPAILNADGNRITFEPGSKAGLRRVQGGRVYIYLREGGLSFDAAAQRVFVCASNQLFVGAAQSRGVVRIGAAGKVGRGVERGRFAEEALRGCDENGVIAALTGVQPAGFGSGVAGGTAGGTAAGSGAAAGSGTAAGVAAVAAGGAVAVGTAAASSGASTAAAGCTSPLGCNFNPPAVSPSQP